MTKRLFIFAGYDQYSIVDSCLLYYLNALSALGDIIFVMDNEPVQDEIDKVRAIPNVLYAGAMRHGEYDFGSYKRGYQWADENNLFDKYDWVYFVNDSVFGPLFDLKPVLEKMESENAGNAFGMIGLHSTPEMKKQNPTHVQSWFVAIAAPIVQKEWFRGFINAVTHQDDKNQIVYKYEMGLSQLLLRHDVTLAKVVNDVTGSDIYHGFIPGLPFLKKLAIQNIYDIDGLIKRIVSDDALMASILRSIARLNLAQPVRTGLVGRRLFIFASYDRDGIVDDTLLYYLRELSKIGDVVFTMDCDADKKELQKIQEIPNVLRTCAFRHGEYDFGSYKRGYKWAQQNHLLDKYEWIYLVNDSVMGPMFDLQPTLERMERENDGNAFGMVGVNTQDHPEHVQSWFVGIDSRIARTDWFDKFISSVQHHDEKEDIIWKYEIGMSQLMLSKGVKLGRVEPNVCGLEVYDRYVDTVPFVKKALVSKYEGVKWLRKIAPDALYNPMCDTIDRLGLANAPKIVVPMKPIWKIKLFNKLTLLMLESRPWYNTTEYELWLLKLIPIKFIRYNNKKKK